MMQELDIESIKRSVNIVDIIDKYVPLKKAGSDHMACCPFHNEKTPSFTVSEDKQFYHCFGCGAHGDVIEFLIEHTGCEFMDAVKQLGGIVEYMKPEEIIKNEKRERVNCRLPPDHKEDVEMCNRVMDKSIIEGDYVKTPNGKIYLPLKDCTGRLKNMVYFELYDDAKAFPCYIAGGPSYDAFYHIKVKEDSRYFACTDLATGYKISSQYNVNVAVCFIDSVLKYICKWNNGGLKIKPVLTGNEDDYLAYEMPHLFWDGDKLIKRDLKI